ncbi:Response regulator receiver domain protein [Desulfosarcina cetonica]|uniref:response regulator transcription factor n=1 Tax=Desulfosarcina cetonica TaxID=90730 RepID=UPI0006D2B430|nr:response regulator [Desulfosarcina cetonica]VTR70238.1 Response regulator receiver domain protein [Desulfosarcina cetonica]
MKSILIVDDDANAREALRRTLERAGYTVLQACDGNEAIEWFNNHHPDLVIMDLFMPEKEGLETIFDLKREHKDIKIIAISGGWKVGSQNYLEAALELGADDYIAKPFNSETLMTTINKALSASVS